MGARIVRHKGGKLAIEVDMELNGKMLSQEEAGCFCPNHQKKTLSPQLHKLTRE
jgi:hypothetical protein